MNEIQHNISLDDRARMILKLGEDGLQRRRSAAPPVSIVACEQGRGETLLERGNHGDGRFVERCHGCAELYNSCHGWVMLCGGVVSVLYIYLGSAR